MDQMLHVSDDNAADALWFKYGASFYTSYFPRIGLTSAQYLPQEGVTGAYWGEMTCTPDDLDRLINYVLGSLPASLSGYLVGELRHVASVQHFGVWGAGPDNEPGNKDGWSVEKPGWIIDSVGFAGPGAEYTLTLMNSLQGEGDYQDGDRHGDPGRRDPVPGPPDSRAHLAGQPLAPSVTRSCDQPPDRTTGLPIARPVYRTARPAFGLPTVRPASRSHDRSPCDLIWKNLLT